MRSLFRHKLFGSYNETTKTPLQRTLLPDPTNRDVPKSYLDIVERIRLKNSFSGIVLLSFFTCLNYGSRFPDGVKKRENPTMTTSTITVRRKGDPQHMLRKKNK